MSDPVIWLVVLAVAVAVGVGAAVAVAAAADAKDRWRPDDHRLAGPGSPWPLGQGGARRPRVVPAVVVVPSNPPPGWYRDPQDPDDRRWWTGVQWEPSAPR